MVYNTLEGEILFIQKAMKVADKQIHTQNLLHSRSPSLASGVS